MSSKGKSVRIISIVHCGAGNVGSVSNMLRRIGHGAKVASTPDDVRSAGALILPGVGTFDAGMVARARSTELLRRLIEANAFLTLVLPRPLTPSYGGQSPYRG